MEHLLNPPMKTSVRILATACLGAVILSSTPLHAEEPTRDETIAAKLAKTESIGKLTLEMKGPEVEKLLGAADSKSKNVHEEGGGGEWVQTWKFAKQGIELRMGSEKEKEVKRILLITAKPACKLATARGVKIGATKEEVEKAYKDVKATDASFAEEGTFAVGSISPGLVFQFKDGKVSTILLGELGD